MADEKKRLTPPEFLDALHRFLTSTDGQSIEELDEELKAEGIDPAAFRGRVAAMVAAHTEERRLSWHEAAAAKRRAIEDKLAALRLALPRGKEELLARVRALTETMGPRTAEAYFHRFEEAREEDLPGLVADLEEVIAFGGLDDETTSEP